jgi:N-acetylneuraminate epimerase
MGLCAALASVAIMAGMGAAVAEEWPDLPVGIKNGIAAQIGDRLIVGLGSAGTDILALDLNDRAAGWQKLASFDDPAPSQPAAAVSGGALYVFSGSGKADAAAASPVIFDTVHRYDPQADAWETLGTTTPAGLLGASAMTLGDGRIAIIGGYNKELFDRYIADVTAIDKEAEPERWNAVVNDYMGMTPKEYRWNDRVLLFDPADKSWSDLGANPELPNTGAAVVETAPGEFLVINGEIKPGLRTDAVKRVTFGADGATWQAVAPVPAPAGSELQEGLAGAYAGLSHDHVIVAGGANFPGARQNAEAGNWFAHEGLSKHWASDVFVLDGEQWQEVGELPLGLAYGASFSVDDTLLVVGGEDATGTARMDVFALEWNGDKLAILD